MSELEMNFGERMKTASLKLALRMEGGASPLKSGAGRRGALQHSGAPRLGWRRPERLGRRRGPPLFPRSQRFARLGLHAPLRRFLAVEAALGALGQPAHRAARRLRGSPAVLVNTHFIFQSLYFGSVSCIHVLSRLLSDKGKVL